MPVEDEPAMPPLALLVRTAGLLGVWLVVAGAAPAGLAVGVAVAVIAGGVSLCLLPVGAARPRALGFVLLVLRFVWQSGLGGLDVARRAFDPRLPLQLGFVTYRVRLAAGPVSGAFAALSSLVPGTLPAGSDAGGGMLVHCLDVGQPVAAQLAADEVLLAQALGLQP